MNKTQAEILSSTCMFFLFWLLIPCVLLDICTVFFFEITFKYWSWYDLLDIYD